MVENYNRARRLLWHDGYVGKILWVNLSTSELKDEPLSEELCRQYVGGYGLGAKIIFDRMPAGTDPLGP